MKKWLLFLVISFVIGALFSFLVIQSFKGSTSSEQSHIIAYEIKKLNKMIVTEQTYSDLYSHKSSKYIPGLQSIYTADKKVILLINAKVQATYDLKQMRIKVDSLKKSIHISYIPPLEINIYPDIQFYDLEQSTFNRFEKQELNDIKQRGVEHIEKTIDKTKIEKEAHEQLIENLSDIYVLAKIYGWKVIDDTSYAAALREKAQKEISHY